MKTNPGQVFVPAAASCNRRPAKQCGATRLSIFAFSFDNRAPIFPLESSHIANGVGLNFAMELPPRLARALGLQRKVGPITSIHIFDFDGTLVRTPGPDEGKRKYMSETGKPWAGGWWGRPGSLSPPVVESPFPQSLVVKTAFDEMEEVITRSQTAVGVVVTGRIKPLREAVLRILEEICIASKNDTVKAGESFLHPDAVFTHPGGRLTTLEFKKELFKTLVTMEPLSSCPIEDVHIWEDRKEHAEVFASETTDLLRRIARVNTVVHFIPPEAP